MLKTGHVETMLSPRGAELAKWSGFNFAKVET